MIDARKVHMMTKIARYESGIGKKEEKIYRRYSRRTYLAVKQLETLLALTIAYATGSILYSMQYITDILTDSFPLSYSSAFLRLGIGYLLFVGVGMIITGKIYARRYDQLKEHIRQYNYELYRLNRYLDESSRQEAGSKHDKVN